MEDRTLEITQSKQRENSNEWKKKKNRASENWVTKTNDLIFVLLDSWKERKKKARLKNNV